MRVSSKLAMRGRWRGVIVEAAAVKTSGPGEDDGDGQQGRVGRDKDSSRLVPSRLPLDCCGEGEEEMERATKGGGVLVMLRSESRRPSRWEALGQ